MIKSHGRQFEYKYEGNSRSSNLAVSLPKNENLVYHQMDMILNNCITGIPAVHLLVTDDMVNLYYDVTSKLTLEKFLSLKELDKRELLNLLLNIMAPLRFCDGYLLYDRCFVLDEQFIFVDPGTLKVFLIYIPVDTDEDFTAKFRRLVTNIITSSARLADSPVDDNYIQRILESLKQENFSTNEFREFINSMFSETPMPEPRNRDVESDDMDAEHRPHYERVIKDRDIYELLKDRYENAGRRWNQGEDERLGLRFLQTITLQLIVLLVFLIAYRLLEWYGKPFDVLYGLAVILAALDVYVARKILGRNYIGRLRSLFKRAREMRECGDRPDKIVWRGKTPDEILEEFNHPPYTVSNKEIILRKRKESAPALAEVYEGETEVLEKTDSGVPSLKGISELAEEEIPVVKDSLVIGRLEDMVDYVVRNRAVGKVHAEILYRNGGYYIRDLNSRNGTYINGEKLDGNKDYTIENGDRITIANSEYEFVVP